MYEQFYGRIQSSGEFFRLVMDHDWFSWLRPISKFIVQIDEFLAAKTPTDPDQADALMQAARTLLQPSQTGTPQEQRYFLAIQRDPQIAMMHAEVSQILQANRPD